MRKPTFDHEICVALVALWAFAAAPPAQAQPVPVAQTGVVTDAQGLQLSIVPGTLYNMSCNGGKGGVVGQLVPDGARCGFPGGEPAQSVGSLRSGASAIGGAWQQLAAANANRLRLLVQNPCLPTDMFGASGTVTEPLYLSFAASQPLQAPSVGPMPITLMPCMGIDTSEVAVSTLPMWVWTASSGHRFFATEY